MKDHADALVTPSSGDVFADLDLPNAEDRLAKAELAHQISTIIDERGLTQREAADALGIDQPRVSTLVSGRLAGFSLERLAHFLTRLGKDVDIVVRDTPASRPVGRVRVAVESLVDLPG